MPCTVALDHFRLGRAAFGIRPAIGDRYQHFSLFVLTELRPYADF
jgi:hypothetical protein